MTCIELSHGNIYFYRTELVAYTGNPEPSQPRVLEFDLPIYSAEVPNSGDSVIGINAVVTDQYGDIMYDANPTYTIVSQHNGVTIDASTGVVTISASAMPGIVPIRASYGDLTRDTFLLLSPKPIKTYAVSGKIQSYNPNNETIVRLYQDSELKYTTSIAPAYGIGQHTQDFNFKEVEPGTYTLVITKAQHTSFTVRTIVVGDEDLDLTKDSRAAVRVMTLLCGDINGDNMINNADLVILWMAVNYNKSVAQAADPRCDLNGDGMINNADLVILWMAVNYNKGPVVIA